MNTGELACEILESMAELTDKKVSITGFEICRELIGKESDQGFINLLRELMSLGIVERYDFVSRGIIGYYIRLSEKGTRMVSKIKDNNMQKYFIVAITIYCNQKKFTPNELGELLSKTDSFENKDEVEKIIKNFQKNFIIEEKPVIIGEISKIAVRIKDCVFDMIAMEEVKENTTSV